MKKPVIAVTMGDSSGIGPELIIKTLSNKDAYNRCNPFVAAHPDVISKTARVIGVDIAVRPIADIAEAQFSEGTLDVLCPEGLDVPEIRWGVVDPAMGRAAAGCLEQAFRLAMEGKVDGVVSAPLNKEAFHKAGFDYLDELEFLAELTGSPAPTIMGVLDAFWTIPVTEHVPFREIADLITTERIYERTVMLNRALKKTGRKKPKIAVAALNVHAGEGGLFGNEEIAQITPAIQKARDENIDASGPFPADTVFVTAMKQNYDGIVCMYHDQANIARKLLATRTGVTLFMGLPVPCATTAHGTAFDIAGKGRADPGSLRNALKFAAMLCS